MLIRNLLVAVVLLYSFGSQAQIVFGKNKSDQAGLNINYSSPQEFEIAEITVEGVEFLDNNALISLSGLRVGDKIKIPGDEISSAIKKLWKQGIIGDISIFANKVENGQVFLTINLSERPRLTKYKFKGVNRTFEGELKDKVELVRGKILTNTVIKNTELAVKRFMEGKGYLNAEVNVLQLKDTLVGNSVEIIIDIEKNQKVKVKNINFIDREHFTSAKLRSKIKDVGETPRIRLPKDILAKTINLLNPANFYHFLTHRDSTSALEMREYLGEMVKVNVFKSAKFVREDYEEGKKNIISFYNSKGFRDAEISYDSVYNVNNKYLNIDVKVDNGKKYYFKDIIWTGNYIYTAAQLDKILGIAKGDVYDLELVNKKLNYNPTGTDISSLYMDDGYLFFTVSPVEVGVEDDSISLEMRIFEGVQATINEITISGNDKTNDHVILRELRTLPGQKFSRADLIRTQRELSQLGYFDPEQVNPIPKPNPVDETVDIEWQLVERPNDQVELSGGWGGAFGFVGTLGVSFNNFSLRNIPHLDKWRPLPMGDGQRFSVRLQANGRRFQSYTVSFSEPWLGGRKPNNFGVNFSHSVQRQIDRFTNETLGSLKVTGITISLGRRLQWPDDYFTLSNSIGFQKYDLFQFGNSLGFSTGDANSFTFNTTLARSSVDNPMYPRTGSSVSLSASITPPYSLWSDLDYDNVDNATKYQWLEYHKWNLDLNYYLKLVGNLVLAPRFHFGYIGTYTDRVGVGPFERFQLGGDGLTGQNFLLGTDVIGLRGYENNIISPEDPVNNIRGGTMFTKFVMELRYPISLNPSATIYFLTFFDGGNNWDDFEDFNPYNLYRSAGIGVRLFMPAFGLLGLDWGYGLDPAPGQLEVSGPQFHFSIGQQIR
ncbi:MAG: outer membrane protein insertion porin family [Cyclobacteriaceae bacterium]